MEIEQLLNGKLPTLNDYSDFCGVCEKLPKEILWRIITEYPDMHHLLRIVAQDNLREKIHQANMERFNQSLLEKFAKRFPDEQ